jgi:hypothetical protein
MPQELTEDQKRAKNEFAPFYESVNTAGHLLYMCEMGKSLVINGRTEKAMRWLGFLQGVVWARGIASIDGMKHWNMPKEAE